MHEFSIMSQMVQILLAEIKNNNLRSVSRVKLAVGDLTFLGEEQLKFCYDVLAKDNILKGSELVIEKVEPEIRCTGCEYTGTLEYQEADEFHFRLPQFTCPKCNSKVDIIKGKDCIIQEITGET